MSTITISIFSDGNMDIRESADLHDIQTPSKGALPFSHRRMTTEERGFYRLMVEGFQQDECPLNVFQKFRAKQVFKRRPEVRGEMVDMLCDALDEDTTPSEKRQIASLVGAIDTAEFSGIYILQLAANENRERNWKDYGDAMVKIWKVIFEGLSKILPIFFA